MDINIDKVSPSGLSLNNRKSGEESQDCEKAKVVDFVTENGEEYRVNERDDNGHY